MNKIKTSEPKPLWKIRCTLGEGTLSGIIVEADHKTGLAKKITRLIEGGSLNK